MDNLKCAQILWFLLLILSIPSFLRKSLEKVTVSSGQDFYDKTTFKKQVFFNGRNIGGNTLSEHIEIDYN